MSSANEVAFQDDEFIISKTNLNGQITYGNEHFVNISGYSETELLGAPHNILRHPDMPRTVFKLLWEHITKGEEIFAYVKNLNKNGAYYWVFAHVTPSFDNNGKIIGYHSVRRKPKRSSIDKIISIYEQLLHKERQGGTSSAEAFLGDIIKSKGFANYAEFIFSI